MPGRSAISASTAPVHSARLLDLSIQATLAVIAATSASVRLADRASSSLGLAGRFVAAGCGRPEKRGYRAGRPAIQRRSRHPASRAWAASTDDGPTTSIDSTSTMSTPVR